MNIISRSVVIASMLVLSYVAVVPAAISEVSAEKPTQLFDEIVESTLPEKITKKIRPVFAQFGFKEVEFLHVPSQNPTPALQLFYSKVGNGLCIGMNEQAESALLEKPGVIDVFNQEEEDYLVGLGGSAATYQDDEGELIQCVVFENDNYFSSPHVLSAILHELGHAVLKHRERGKTTKKISKVLALLSGAAAYKSITTCAYALSDSFVTKLCATAAGLYGAFKIYPHIKTASDCYFTRKEEREADQFVFCFKSRELTQARKEFFEKTIAFNDFFKKHRREGRIHYSWWNRNHPTDEERLAACEKALEKFETQ